MFLLSYIKRHGNSIGLILILLAIVFIILIYRVFYYQGIKNIEQLSRISGMPSVDVNQELFDKILNDLKERAKEKPPLVERNPFL